MRTTVRGSKNLATILGVHFNTVGAWKKAGVLDRAILCNYGRTIIYDLDKVYESLNYRPVSPGRKRV